MPVDYDLAVIGGTLAGRWAARKAAQTGARVVLIEPSVPTERQWLPTPSLAAALTPQHLALHGVDVVTGQPSFEGTSPIQLLARLHGGTRRIHARTGLLAMAGASRPYNISGLMASRTGSVTTLARDALPKRVALVGQQATTVEWAVALRQQACEVTLVMPTDRVLPTEDVDVQRLVTAQLLALGIRCIPNTTAPKFTPTPSGISPDTSAAQQSAPVDPVVGPIVLTDSAPPDLSALNLPNIPQQQSLSVNAYLQTQHPRLYAMGAVLGGEDRLTLALIEANAAVENALFWNRRTVCYDRVHYSLEGLTPVGRAGLTEQQAHRYCDRVETYQSGTDGASPYTVDFCKLVVAEERLVGIHLMGAGADCAIALLAAYLGLPISRLIQELEHLPTSKLSDSLGTQLVQAIEQYQGQRWRPGTWRRDWAENWFNWRRSRR